MDRDKAIRAAKLTLGGMLEKKRHTTAVSRADGQIAPSKYLPNVPRAVHADGGRENGIAKGGGGNVEGKRDFTQDNPGGEWLEGKQARAAQYPDRKFVAGAITGVIGGRSSMFLPTHILKGIAGMNDETRTAGVHKYDSLLSDAQEGGFDHNQKGNKVVVAVNHYGQPYLLEGNTRVAVAHSLGIPKVKAEVRYWNGAENVDGPMHPDQVFGMASDSPEIAKAGGGPVGKAAFQQGNHPEVPDVVYHGTQSDIQTFRQSQTGEFGPGIYMTDLPEEAADYAGTHPFAGKGPNVMPLHLSMKNPFVVKSDPQEFWQKFGGKWDEDAQKNAIAAGHDGVMFRRPYMKWDDSLKREVPTGKHHTHFVAFNPTQVKSAISAQNFDPTDPDITKAEGGAVTDTDEFRNWFGNSVTHTNGDPHVFYTGTSKDKDFTSHNVGRHGAWFVRDPAVASEYAEQNDSQGYKREGFKLTPTNTASRVIPAYVKAENPYTGELPEEYLRDNYKAAQSEWFDTLRAKGHDSWVPASQNGNLVVALKEPQQIKSVFNNGKFDPNQKHMNKAEGGRVGYADGGKSLGLHSKAAQIIRNQSQAKGSVDQLLAMVSKAKGVKPAELTNAGRPTGDTMTKEELAQHFEQALPDVQVMRKGRDLKDKWNKDRSHWSQEDWDKWAMQSAGSRQDSSYLEAMSQPSTRYDQYVLSGGENYREHLLHLPPQDGPLVKRRNALQAQWQKAYENQVPKEELDRMGAEIDSLSSNSDGENVNFKSNHWKTPNVLAHVRMSDRDNGKTLHVHEVQSDWGQEGRDKGFHDPENPYEVVNRKTKEVVSRHPDYGSAWDAYRTHPDSDNLDWGDSGDEKPPKGPYVGNTQQWTDLALKHVLTEAAKGGYDRVVFSPGEANADLYGQRKEVQMLKFLKSKDSGEAGILSAYSKDGRRSSEHEIASHDELAKLLGKENATSLLSQPQTPSPENGEDRYTHTLQGPMTVGGQGMVDYYKNYAHSGALKLLQPHDPSIKPESYDLPNDYKGFGLPMTETARQSILKNGFQAFQRGGTVGKATGGPVMGYVPMATLPTRRLAVAPIQQQQPQASAGTFSKSLASMIDTVEGFKERRSEDAAPQAQASPSASSEGHAPTREGMSGSAEAAYAKLLDAYGQPLTINSSYRDPKKNAEVGGADNSQHIHGNAYDVDVSGKTYEERVALANQAWDAGFRGIGFYDNSMHFDVGDPRSWGPSYSRDSIPEWAQGFVEQRYGYKSGGRIGKEGGGSVDDDIPNIKNPMSVFPKPQRMFPEDQRPAGGQYLSAHNKADVTGHKAESASIGIGPNGKPFFQASQNAVDQTGTSGRGSATVKTNLFKKKAGWKWENTPDGHENTDTIVSVEHRGKHIYALNAHFPRGVDLARYENSPSEPRLRPTTQGNVTLGPQAGSISVRGKMHPVYHHVIVKAAGGAVESALAITRGFTKDGKSAINTIKPKGK